MNNQTTEQMPAVVTFDSEVQTKIEELKEDNYYLDDMIQFIEEYGKDAFIAHYEDYVKYGEDYSYDAVDAFIGEYDIDCIQHFCDSYYGAYESEEDFAEQFTRDVYGEPPAHLVVDWAETWNQNLRYDFSFANGFVFNNNY